MLALLLLWWIWEGIDAIVVQPVVMGKAVALHPLLIFLSIMTFGSLLGFFGVLIAVNGGRDAAPTLDDIAGLWLVRPWLASAMAVFLLAFLGMPLVGGMGFFAKWYLLGAALASIVQLIPDDFLTSVGKGILFVLGALVSGFAYKAGQALWDRLARGKKRSKIKSDDTD